MSPKIDHSKLQSDIKVVSLAWEKSPYYDDAERWLYLFWNENTSFRQLFDRLKLARVVELACGHGRHAEQIASRAESLSLFDIFESNLDVCRKRLAKFGNIAYFKGDGGTFQPLGDNSQTAIFCYDAMVHFSPEIVKSYLIDTARILEPGGMALFHHSNNYKASLDEYYGKIPAMKSHVDSDVCRFCQ